MPSDPHAHRPPEDRTLNIPLSLNRVDDLFVAFDPSPFVKRDIDNAIEEYVVETATDAPRGRPITLTVFLPPAEAAEADAGVLSEAFQNYFAFMRNREDGRIRRLWRAGRQSLGIGMAFLAVCLALGQGARALAPGAFGAVLAEGLTIAGWVANWRPIEIFLYDWRPLRRRREVYDELSRVSVIVNVAPLSG